MTNKSAFDSRSISCAGVSQTLVKRFVDFAPTKGRGHDYVARFYNPQLGRFAQADTVTPGGVQGLDRYAGMANNPVRYVDPTGHFGSEVHFDLTFYIVFMTAFEEARNAGYNEIKSLDFASNIATEVAVADIYADDPANINNLAIWKPSGDSKTSHWYTTEEAEEWLGQAASPTEFGEAMHAFQDSFSHWQKLDKPDSAADIWDKHLKNQYEWFDKCNGDKNCSVNIDYYDPNNDPIDAAMKAGVETAVKDFIVVYMERQNMYVNRKATYDSDYVME